MLPRGAVRRPGAGLRAAPRDRALIFVALTFVAVLAGAPLSGLALGAGPASAASAAVLSPPALAGARLDPVAYGALEGWAEDDAAAAFDTFRNSCGAVGRVLPDAGPASAPTLTAGLAAACAAAARLGPGHPSPVLARLFFEANFRPFRVVPDGGGEGFYTGYYEVEAEGSAVPTETYAVPVYARPKDLVMESPTANSGAAGRLVDGRLVPYFDRAAIEDGALAGQGLELVWLKDPVDLFFMQIQGSGRVRLADGRVLKLNYDGFNGHLYLPVGRLLIARGIVPREEMSMDRIRAFMEADPEAGRALRRENPSYVFFKALDLPADAGAMGAQGVPLTAGRSLAVDRHLHSYGTPVFVQAELPLAAPGTAEPFRRLMIAQDTGSAIRGPARADLYFGAGREAGSRAGRIRHAGGFTLLVPRLVSQGGAGTTP
ncbi:MltA domain-containing protein [Xanthobacter sp. KR7-225]|uniref:murein transglycosylase A n=1 Tax=Xanthobacter sp. KR7-225 TaxID=3156613 RepID=UPI0032B4DE41